MWDVVSLLISDVLVKLDILAITWVVLIMVSFVICDVEVIGISIELESDKSLVNMLILPLLSVSISWAG